MHNFNGVFDEMAGKVFKSIAIGGAIAVVAFPLAKLAVWGGRMVMRMSEQHQGRWQGIALKIAAAVLYTIAGLAGITAIAGVTAFMATYMSAALGLAGGWAFGHVGAGVGVICGLMGGMVAGAGITAVCVGSQIPCPR